MTIDSRKIELPCGKDNVRRMDEGALYNSTDPALVSDQNAALELLYDYKHTRPSEHVRRRELLEEMFASGGGDCHIEPPFHANWAGRHVHLGAGFYANFNLTLVDDGPIHIGANVLFGPNVTITTAGHPVLPELRPSSQFNRPVTIGDNVWLGANVVVMPGVTIGSNSVVGADSVVTRDIPANVVAVGVPCRVLRTIGQHDREFYWRDNGIDPSLFDEVPGDEAS